MPKLHLHPRGSLEQLATSVVLLVGIAGSASAATLEFDSMLTGDQEVPPVATAASGSATLVLNSAQDRLTIEIQTQGVDLDGNQTPKNPDDDVILAHIHNAPAGVNGSVVFGFIGPNSDMNGDLVIDAAAGTITSAWDASEGEATTLAAQLQNLFDGELYINIHTDANSGGEIRGQITPPPPIAFVATLSGDQEVPPVATVASGSAALELSGVQDRLTISIQTQGVDLDGNQTPKDSEDDVILAHIHRAPAGMNGSVVFGFIGPNSDTNGDLVIDAAAGTITSAWDANEGASTTLDDELADLFADGLYINIHTNANTDGEIRGQILPEPRAALLAWMAVATIAGLRRRRFARHARPSISASPLQKG